MHEDGSAGRYRAPSYADAATWIGVDSVITLGSQPGMQSFTLAGENGLPAFAEVAYLEGSIANLHLVASVRNWAKTVPQYYLERGFDFLVEHFMSTKLTLHPETQPEDYDEPEFEDARPQEVLVDDSALRALRIDDAGTGLSGLVTSVDGCIVTCTWDSGHTGEPSFARRTI
jgi:hypothetical protein